MYIERHLEKQVHQASRSYPVVMVCGQRQVGKSTMLYHIKSKERHYVTFDDNNARLLAENDPGLFFETYGMPLLIDEFQRVPSILIEIKRIVDEKMLKGEECGGLFWLTGSQKFRMMKNVSESLAGRVAVFELSSLSIAEMEGKAAEVFRADIDTLKVLAKKNRKKDVHEIYERIFRGGMPKIIATEVDRERYYADYINTYLERDIRDLSKVGKINDFYNFLVYMAAHTGQELKYAEIARKIGVSQPTIREWITVLDRSGVILILHPYYSNITKRLVKTPKVYFMDTGLAAYLCRWPSPQTLEFGAMDGAFFETYVVTEIIKSYLNAGKEPNAYYYRDIDRKEIDMLLVEGDTVYPIEIKKSKAPAKADRNFSALEKLNFKVAPGVVICMTDDLIPEKKSLWHFPASAL